MPEKGDDPTEGLNMIEAHLKLVLLLLVFK